MIRTVTKSKFMPPWTRSARTAAADRPTNGSVPPLWKKPSPIHYRIQITTECGPQFKQASGFAYYFVQFFAGEQDRRIALNRRNFVISGQSRDLVFSVGCEERFLADSST